ncbi:hypothetical protein ABBQ32_003603 [Trebouxia sp. C0010 RCD-2024]
MGIALLSKRLFLMASLSTWHSVYTCYTAASSDMYMCCKCHCSVSPKKHKRTATKVATIGYCPYAVQQAWPEVLVLQCYCIILVSRPNAPGQPAETECSSKNVCELTDACIHLHVSIVKGLF